MRNNINNALSTPKIVIVLLLCSLGSGCRDLDESKQKNASTKGSKMSKAEFQLKEAQSRCERGDPVDINQLFKDLRNKRFINSLDDPIVYHNRQMPPNLGKLLSCLAESKNIQGVTDRLLELANTTEYSYDHPEGSLRRKAIVESLANAIAPNPRLIQFLDGEITRSGKYRSSAVAALARFGTTSSLEILDKRIFNPSTSVIAPNSRSIYFHSYCITLAQYRDQCLVLEYLLNRLFPMPELESTVLDCILKDVIILGADPDLQVELAPLNSGTSKAPLLAELLANWIIQNRQVIISFWRVLPDVSKRVTDLLGVSQSVPVSDRQEDIRNWAIRVFEDCEKSTDDRDIRKSVQETLKRLRKSR